MKKTLITVLSLVCLTSFGTINNIELLAAPTYTKVVRDDKGLFGYKDINETHTPNGSGGTNDILACANPGFKSCNWATIAPAGGGLSSTELAEIDILVNEKIEPTLGPKQEGQFIYNTNYLIVYKFTLKPNKLKYEIFTRQEAPQYGYTF